METLCFLSSKFSTKPNANGHSFHEHKQAGCVFVILVYNTSNSLQLLKNQVGEFRLLHVRDREPFIAHSGNLNLLNLRFFSQSLTISTLHCIFTPVSPEQETYKSSHISFQQSRVLPSCLSKTWSNMTT